MKRSAELDAYLHRLDAWQQDYCRSIRELIHRAISDVEEEIRWGAPAFFCAGQLLLGLASFSKHVTIYFHTGALLEDREKLFRASTNKEMRSILLYRDKTIPVEGIAIYLQEAAANARMGKRIIRKPLARAEVPASMQETLDTDEAARSYFEGLSNSCQREYIEWYRGAKRSSTREKRLADMMSMLRNKTSLNERYKKSSSSS